MECLIKDVGFSQGKPVAAFTIYKCLLHWKSFEAEKTSVFDRLIQMIGSAIEVITARFLVIICLNIGSNNVEIGGIANVPLIA